MGIKVTSSREKAITLNIRLRSRTNTTNNKIRKNSFLFLTFNLNLTFCFGPILSILTLRAKSLLLIPRYWVVLFCVREYSNSCILLLRITNTWNEINLAFYNELFQMKCLIRGGYFQQIYLPTSESECSFLVILFIKA